MDALKELMSNIGWMIHDLVDGDQIDNEEEERLQKVYAEAQVDLARLQRIEVVTKEITDDAKISRFKSYQAEAYYLRDKMKALVAALKGGTQ